MRFRTPPRTLDRAVSLDGDNLRQTRERANVSLEAAADYLGLEPHVLSGLEKGYRRLSPAQAAELDSRLSKLTARARVPEAVGG